LVVGATIEALPRAQGHHEEEGADRVQELRNESECRCLPGSAFGETPHHYERDRDQQEPAQCHVTEGRAVVYADARGLAHVVGLYTPSDRDEQGQDQPRTHLGVAPTRDVEEDERDQGQHYADLGQAEELLAQKKGCHKHRDSWREGYDREDQVSGAHGKRFEQHQLSARARESDEQAVESGYRTSVERPLATRG
jgi:hypothetical protein